MKIDHSSKKIKKPEILYEKLEEINLGNDVGGNVENSIDKTFPLKLRVGKIVEVKDHPNADSLYLLKVDFGDKKRQVVAGLKKAFSVKELEGRKTVFCVNLKKAKIRGEVSEAMVLVADKNGKLALQDVGKAKIGEFVEFSGLSASENEVTFDEFLKLKMLVKKDNVYFEKHRLEVSGVPVVVKGLDEARIS